MLCKIVFYEVLFKISYCLEMHAEIVINEMTCLGFALSNLHSDLD